MLVSFCIIAYNEEENLPGLLQDIERQTYPHDAIEVVLVDAMSTDSTLDIMRKFAAGTPDFHKIVLCQNPKKTQPSGWNVAIQAASGDVIIRVDAHAHIPSDFIAQNVRCLRTGECICGGPRPNIIVEETPWKQTLLLAESSMFGSSIAAYRRNTGKSYVNTMFHAAYRREVFEKAGLFNEQLIRTEDNELHYRMRKAGFRFCFDPAINSYQYTRSSLGKLLKQKFQNGYWIGLTAFVCPQCLSLFHFIPFAFTAGIIVTSILTCLGFPFLAYLLWGAYWLLNLGISLLTFIKNRISLTNLALPILFFFLHISYGLGTVWGIIRAPLKYLSGWNPRS